MTIYSYIFHEVIESKMFNSQLMSKETAKNQSHVLIGCANLVT
jgi:hypothetical protein